MDTQLQELIDKIKSEGVRAAEKQAAQIEKDAQRKADRLLADAHREAADIVNQAKREAARFQQMGQEAVKQAGRNTVLSVKNNIMKLFEAVLREQTAEALKGKVLEECILTLVKGWDEQSLPNLNVLLPPDELGRLEKSLRGSLAGRIKRGVEIKPFPALGAGFRIGMKDGSAYYNFSDQGIAEILAEYLNPRLSELINAAVSEES